MGSPNCVGKRTKIPHLSMRYTDIWGTFSSLLKFCRFVGKGICLYQNVLLFNVGKRRFRLQRYYFLPIYANKKLFFYVIVGTMVVISVDVVVYLTALLGC